MPSRVAETGICRRPSRRLAGVCCLNLPSDQKHNTNNQTQQKKTKNKQPTTTLKTNNQTAKKTNSY